jgi:hypothetical protein
MQIPASVLPAFAESFGGCTISLVESSHVEDFVNQVASGYASQTGLTPDVYVCRAEEGAKECLYLNVLPLENSF